MVSEINSSHLHSMAKILRVIAHPVKLNVILLLGKEGTMDVSSLCERLDCGCQKSMMSHHLHKMKDNGIVNSEKNGKQVFYSLTDPNILNIFECITKCQLD